MTISKLPLGRKVLRWPNNIEAIRKNFLREYEWAALLRPVVANEPGEPDPNPEDLS